MLIIFESFVVSRISAFDTGIDFVMACGRQRLAEKWHQIRWDVYCRLGIFIQGQPSC